MTKPRRRRVHSVADELVHKSREAALAAVQIFNSPQIAFKSELFIVVMIIAWTYLMHAYFRTQNIDYRYFKQNKKRRTFDKTKSGAFKHWELERCLNDAHCPLDSPTKTNLRFLIGLRHEIEHQMTTRIDHTMSAKFQACCLNFNSFIKATFGEEHGIDKHLAFSLQFSAISQEQLEALKDQPNLPKHIEAYVNGFESQMSDTEFDSPKYAYRVLFVAKTANRKGQADKVIEFIKTDSPLATEVNKTYALIKETERQKFLPKRIVKLMKAEGFKRFSMHHHTQLWKENDGKNPSKGYGTNVEGAWYWYEPWISVVRQHCQEHAAEYK